MSTLQRAICSVVLVFPVLFQISAEDKINQPPRPTKALPVAKPFAEKQDAHGKATPTPESLEKRRERMKQRDGQIDRILKGKQHPER
jgi:hypothetical protein